ncbi:oligosaccharide flippase family protein [uncultured Paracoccus sp.]|uniref:lipopolysaccharide biosynthesis protein n=1 Tax=uncultured Paracoccus sp. TaxID=189685 RepID=UPI002602ED96|nr:oligosaccharide flippase family protein [uncultured Paracoccus sp.]
MGTRFLLVFFLARFLEPEAVGYYGLFTATVGFVLYFLGLDFYVYTTRELLKLPEHERAKPVKGQAMLSLGLYAVVLPAAFVVLAYLGWPRHLIWWFLGIVVLEHINQEIFRLLIALSRQIHAGFLLFARQGSWALAVVALMAAHPGTRHLDMVMGLWAGSGLVTVMLGLWCIRRQPFGSWRQQIDWRWVRRGVKVSAAFLIATLSLRAMQASDRYLMEAFVGLEGVAAYVLFLGVASALMTFLDAGIFAFAYPELISLHHQEDYAATRRRVLRMLWQTLWVCGIFSVGSWLALPYLLAWIGNPVYSRSIGLYPWLLLATILNAIGMVPHYALYASGRDRPIIQSHLAALPAFLFLGWILGGSVPNLAVPIALAMSFALILVWKTVAYLRHGLGDPTNPPIRQ